MPEAYSHRDLSMSEEVLLLTVIGPTRRKTWIWTLAVGTQRVGILSHVNDDRHSVHSTTASTTDEYVDSL